MRLLTDAQVAEKLACHKATVWRMTASGRFPQPVREGRRTRWVESEVHAHIRQLQEARDEGKSIQILRGHRDAET